MLTTHYPALLIILPLMAAPFCIIARQANIAFIVASIANIFAVFISLALLQTALSVGPIHYSLGGWAVPTGIEYYIDTLNASLMVVICIISLLTLIYSKTSIKNEIAVERHYLFYAGWLLCLTGLLGITITGDAFNVFVFLEISSLAMYMLIAMGKERKQALLAAFRYLIMGSIGASFILVGIGFLYAATGTLNMLDLGISLPAVKDSRTVIVGFSFITVGLLIKAAVFPVYSWLPGSYQFAPTAVAAFLAGTATKVSLYVFLRFFFHVFGTEFSFAEMLLGEILLPLAVIGFLAMSMVAILQSDIRRLLAYSSIAQIGYILAVVGLATHEGIQAGVIHIINHAFIKSALFIAVGCIFYRLGSTKVCDMSDLLSRMPWTASAFIIAGLSLIGLPLTAGFISKWYLVSAAINSDSWIMAAMMLVSSIMAIIYVGKIIEAFCFKKSDSEDRAEIKEAPLSMLIPLWVTVLISLYCGIQGDVVVELASQAASDLLGGMQ
jgi:multicomponent Na+:H+ antiporter subunit D